MLSLVTHEFWAPSGAHCAVCGCVSRAGMQYHSFGANDKALFPQTVVSKTKAAGHSRNS